MQTRRPESVFIHALAFMICFIPIGRCLINPESLSDIKIVPEYVSDIKTVEQSDTKSGVSLRQDARHSSTSDIHHGGEVNQNNQKIMKHSLKKDENFQKDLSSFVAQSNTGGLTSSNRMLLAYAPEFDPLKTSNPDSVPQTQRIRSNYPNDVSLGVKSNSGHRSRPVQRMVTGDPDLAVPIHEPSVSKSRPLNPTQHIGEQDHNIMDMQPANFLQHIDRQNTHISGQREPSRKSYSHRKTRLHNMINCDAESDVSPKHQTTDAMAEHSEHEKQALNLETLPMTKDVQIQQRHQSSMADKMSTKEDRSKKDSSWQFEPDSTFLKEGALRDESPPQFVKVTGSLSIKDKNFHCLSLKAGVETLEEKENHLGLSKQTPSRPNPTQIELHIDRGMILKVPNMLWNETLDPLESNSRFENERLKKAPEEVSIKTSTPRDHEYQSSENARLNRPETEIRGMMPKDRDNWNILKNTVKRNLISKMNLSQGSRISELPKLQHRFGNGSSRLNLRPVLISSLAEAVYDVNVDSGFLPRQMPSCRLVGAPWNVWEETWDLTSGFRPGIGEDDDQRIRAWRKYIREGMPVIDAKPLQDQGVVELRRAHSLLAFLTHTYVHSEARNLVLRNDYQVIIPRALAIPFCAVSDILDIPPVLTYADTVLYNWKLKDQALGFTLENVEIPSTFTRSVSESHFFKTSLLIETIGPQCLRLMCLSLDEASIGDEKSVQRICEHLVSLIAHIKCITSLLNDVRKACDPREFYWEIRPWFNGGKWIMEGVPASPGPWRATEFGGPSAGQSTLIHSLDIFLGIDHSSRPGEMSKEETFMERMAAYMPHLHRKFLQHLFSYTGKIRSLVLSSGSNSLLATRYNSAVAALEDLRNSHSRVALLYIISQSRIEPPVGSAFIGEWEEKMMTECKNRQVALSRESGNETVHTGTGGTDLAKFLKRCRARTKEALI